MKFTFGPLMAAAAASLIQTAASTPVERVVTLLTDLKSKLEMDEKTEHKIYDKYACWCEKTTARKAADIEANTADLRAYGQTILSLKGQVATLASEIAELESGIKENLESQEQATALREKENAAYASETAEMKQALASLEKAITVLISGTAPASGSALLQESTMMQVKSLVAALPISVATKTDKISLLGQYLSDSAKYMPQSLTVQGILKDMYETFAQDLESSTLQEATANRNFEDFIAVKTKELKEMKALKEKKEGEKASSELQLSDTQTMFDDTAGQKQADIEFFDETKAACSSKHEQWTSRSTLREEELEGVNKALEILTSDSARELFASAIKAGKETGASDEYKTGRDITPSFIQLNSAKPSEAYQLLKKTASAERSLRLAVLAVQVKEAKAGHFEKVLMAIDTMVKQLKEEDAADIAKRDQCKDEYLKVESTVKDLNWKIEKNQAKIEKLTKLIELRTQQKEETVAEIASVEEQMAVLTADREAENAAFLHAKQEDQDAIDLLMEARSALSAYYSNHSIDMGPVQGSVKGVNLLQGMEPEFNISADQAPNATFSHEGHRSSESKGIVSILTMIIEDLNDEIKNGMKAEEVAQLDYEHQMAAAQQLHSELVDRKANLEAAIAQRGLERSDEEEYLEENQASLDDEIEYKKSITPDCDWIIGSFEKRAAARRAELDGLAGAKEFLVGYQDSKAPALVQKQSSEVARELRSIRFLGLRG